MSRRAGPSALLIAIVLLIASAAALCAGPTATREPEGLPQQLPPLEIRAQVGFDARHSAAVSGAWNPVTLALSNNTDREFYGKLTLSTTRAGEPGAFRLTRPVHLAPHETGQVVRTTVLVDAGDTRLEISLTGNQGEFTSTSEGILIAPHLTRSIVVLGEAGEDAVFDRAVTYPHDELRKGSGSYRSELVPLVGQTREEPPPGTTEAPRAHWQIAAAQLQSLPERWIGYGGVTDVVLAKPSIADKLTPAQLAALTEWVRSGGHLLIELAPDGGAPEPSARLRGLLAATPAKPEQMPRESVINAFGGPRGLEGSMEVCPLIPAMDLEQGREPSPDVLTSDGRQLLVSFPLGLGRVMAIGFSLADNRLMASKEGYQTLLEQVFQFRMGETPDALRQDNASQVAHQVDFELKSEELKEIPSHRVLLAFLAAYCVLVAPVNRLVFARAGRPLGAWLAMPLIVFAFIGIAFTQLSTRRPDTALLREISVVQVSEGARDALVRSYLSLYSPDRMTYRLTYPSANTAVHPLSSASHRGLDRQLLEFADGVGAAQLDPKTTDKAAAALAATYRLEAITLAPRSRANLEAVHRESFGGSIGMSLRGGTVHNGLKVPLDGGIYLPRNGGTLDIPALRPDESLGATGGTHGLDELLAHVGRDRQAISTIVAQLRQVARPAAILWTSQPISGVTCAAQSGESPTRSPLTFFVVTEKGDR